MQLTQRAVWSVLHDEERNALHHIVFQDAHDRGMLQVGDGTGLLKKVSFIIICQPHLKYFNCSQSIEVYMLAEVDISETPLSNHLGQAEISKLLTYTVWHVIQLLLLASCRRTQFIASLDSRCIETSVSRLYCRGPRHCVQRGHT